MFNKESKKSKFAKYQQSPQDVELDPTIIVPKKDRELQYLPKEKVSFSFRVKRFWFGLLKESKRISWARFKDLRIGMITVLSIMIILATVLLGITKLIVATGIVF